MPGRKYLRSLAVAGAALTSPLFVVAAHAQDAWGVFSNSNYGYCDAKKIAYVWKKNIDGGKVVIGNKILAGLQSLADADIASTANSVRCSWPETQLSYSDAQKLGAYWGRSANEAKGKAVDLMSQYGSKRFMAIFRNVLGRSRV